jgi:acyl transferase domain-containing protein/acyl carrier protein
MQGQTITLQEIQIWLVSQLSAIIEVAPQLIDIREPFSSYGLTSKDAICLSGDLEEWLGRELPPTIVYNYPDIASLARYLACDFDDDRTSPHGSIGYQQVDPDPIAVIGIGCRFPGAENPKAFWNLLCEGVDAITEVPPDRWDARAFYDPDPATPGKMNTRWGGFLDDVAQFDAQFFGISPREAERMDPQQRLLLEVSWEALEDAGLAPERMRGTKTAVFIGVSTDDYGRLLMRDALAIDAYSGTGNAFSIAANRLSYFFDFRGPSIAVDTACSSSLVAVHLACQSLRTGESDLALAGGVNLILTPDLNITFSQARMMASDGRCKAFDERANGYVRGEGCGVVALKRLSQSIRDGDRVLALVRGTAVNQDGRSNGLTAPNGAAQEAVIRQALYNAGVSPADISYVEAHGTGTSLGDPIEFDSLKSVLMSGRTPDQICLLGSVKTNIGHLEAAAGIAGLIKVVLSLKYNVIPPVIHFKRLNPRISFDETTFLIPTKVCPWPVEKATRLAGVSSFGFGGVNAHAILENPPHQVNKPLRPNGHRILLTLPEEALPRLAVEADPSVAVEEGEPPGAVLCLSAKSPEALRQLAGRYAQYLDEHPDLSVADLCYTANTGRAQFAHRLAGFGRSGPELSRQLRAYAEGAAAGGLFSGTAENQQPPKIAFLFTGQGAQYIGMGRGLYEWNRQFREALNRCDQLLRGELDKPLLKVIYPEAGDESLLDQTAYTQPALFAFEYALAQVWRGYGVEPGAVLGHSVGDYVGACLAGVFSLEEGLKLIAARGRLMQVLPEGGVMAAVGTGVEQVKLALNGYEKELGLAAINGPEQVVISGARGAVREVCERLAEGGIESHYLSVSHAFHSPLVEPIREEFGRLAGAMTFQSPGLRMISNVTGEAVETGASVGESYWSRQLREPVQFARGMESLRREGYEIFVEVGPSGTLLSLGRNCVREEGLQWIPTLRKGKEDWEQLQEGLTRLWVRGVDVNWEEVAGGLRQRMAGLPTYPFQRQRFWVKSGEGSERPMSSARPSLSSDLDHSLLGHRVRSPILKSVVFESQLSHGSFALDDYRIYETVVTPGAFFLSMALFASEKICKGSSYKLEDVTFSQPLILLPNQTQTIQLILTPTGEQAHSFQLVSADNSSENEDSSWVVHVTGNVRSSQEDAHAQTRQPASLAEVQAKCSETITSTEFYQLYSKQGMWLGPGFQWIEQIWQGDGEALCRMALPRTTDKTGDYLLVPRLIDSCFQLFWAASPAKEFSSTTYVPISIDSFHFYHPPTDRSWCHCILRRNETNMDTLTGDLSLVDETGRIIAEVSGFTAKRASREALLHNVRQELSNWVYEVSWEPQAILTPVSSPFTKADLDSRWLIFADSTGLGAALAARLSQLGHRSLLVFAGQENSPAEIGRVTISASEQAEYVRLFNEVLEGYPLAGIIYLWGLEAPSPEQPTTAELLEKQERICGSFLLLLPELARHQAQMPAAGLWLVTRGAQAAGDQQHRMAVAQSTLWGLGRTLRLEHPEYWGGLVDLDLEGDAAEDAERVLAEIWAGDGSQEIAYRGKRRHQARLGRSPQVEPSRGGFAARDDGSYLITGGLGALGMRMAKWLVQVGARHLLLVSRSAPSGAAAEKLEELEASGVRVVVAAADVACAEQLTEALAQAEAGMPPLRGVIHAAGVVSDGLLLEQRWSQFAEVMSAKVAGGWNLHRYVEGRELDFFVMCSSAAAVLGSPGQGNYAASNAFLDGLVWHRRGRGEVGVSINWGPWSGEGMAASEGKQRWSERGLKLINPEQGVALLREALERGLTQAVVMSADWSELGREYGSRVPKLLRGLVAEGEHGERGEDRRERFRGMLKKLDGVGPQEKWEQLVSYLQHEVALVLELEEPQSVDTQLHMSELGFDSLMALEFRNTLSSVLGVTLPATLIFDHPTIESLARLLGEMLALQLPAGFQAGSVEVTNQDGLTEILARLDSFSETEAEGLLEKLSGSRKLI